MVQETDYFMRKLKDSEVFHVFSPSSIFLLAKIRQRPTNSARENRITAGHMFDFFGKRGILIRNAENFRFLDDGYIRIAIKARQDNEAFLNVLEDWKKEQGS